MASPGTQDLSLPSPWQIVAVTDAGRDFRRHRLGQAAIWTASWVHHGTGGLYEPEFALETDSGLEPLADFDAGLPALVPINLRKEPDDLWRRLLPLDDFSGARCYAEPHLDGSRVLSGLFGSYPAELWATVSRTGAEPAATQVPAIYRWQSGRWAVQRSYHTLGRYVVDLKAWRGGVLLLLGGDEGLRFDAIGTASPPPRFDRNTLDVDEFVIDERGAVFAVETAMTGGCRLYAWPAGATKARVREYPDLASLGFEAVAGEGSVEVTGTPKPPAGAGPEADGPTLRIKLQLGPDGALHEVTRVAVARVKSPPAPAAIPGFERQGYWDSDTGAVFVVGHARVDGKQRAVVIADRAARSVWRPSRPFPADSPRPAERSCAQSGPASKR